MKDGLNRSGWLALGLLVAVLSSCSLVPVMEGHGAEVTLPALGGAYEPFRVAGTQWELSGTALAATRQMPAGDQLVVKLGDPQCEGHGSWLLCRLVMADGTVLAELGNLIVPADLAGQESLVPAIGKGKVLQLTPNVVEGTAARFLHMLKEAGGKSEKGDLLQDFDIAKLREVWRTRYGKELWMANVAYLSQAWQRGTFRSDSVSISRYSLPLIASDALRKELAESVPIGGLWGSHPVNSDSLACRQGTWKFRSALDGSTIELVVVADGTFRILRTGGNVR